MRNDPSTRVKGGVQVNTGYKDADYTTLDLNPVATAFKSIVHKDMAGLDGTTESMNAHLHAITEAQKMVNNNPNVLDKWKLPMSKRITGLGKTKGPMTQVEKILFYRTNPWMFAYDVIGKDVLERTAPTGTVFNGFTMEQKEFMRDALDPRIRKLKLRCCRGGSKTFLLGLLIVIGEYLIPKLRITIQSGNEDQAGIVYTEYFKRFLEDTELEVLVDGEIRRKRTSFIHGGYVIMKTASLKSVKGPRPDWLIIDEVYSTTNEFVIAAMGGALTAHNLKYLVGGTPDTLNNMFYDIDPNLSHGTVTEDGWKIYHWDAYACPWIPEENIEDAKRDYTHEEFIIYIKGNHASKMGHVYPRELVDVAEVEAYPEHIQEYMRMRKAGEEYVPSDILKAVTHATAGTDWGFAHPAAFVIACMDTMKDVYILESFKRSRMNLIDFINLNVAAFKVWEPTHAGADSEDPQKVKLLRDTAVAEGLLVPVQPAKFSVIKIPMITNCKWFFENGKIHIDPNVSQNSDLVDELKAYEYAVSHVETGGVSEKPRKVKDDMCDAFAIAMWFMRRSITDTGDGGMVIGSLNWDSVNKDVEYAGNRRYRRRHNNMW